MRRRVKSAIADMPGVSDLKVEPQVLVPQIDVRLKPDAAEQFGLTAGDVRARGHDVDQGQDGRRSLPAAEGLRSRRLGRPRGPHATWRRSGLPDRDAHRRARAAWARWPTWPSSPRPTRSNARAPRAGSTSPATSATAILGSVAREIEGAGSRAAVRPRLPPGVPRRVRRPDRSRNDGC